MKKINSKALTALFAALAIAAGFCISVFAAAGTSEDPLVSLSYLNGTFKTEIVKAVMDGMDDAFFTEFKQNITEDIKEEVKKSLEEEDEDEDTAASSEYAVVKLERGERIFAKGSCEFILRSGSATCFVTSEENINAQVGLSDCTAGEEILNREDIPRNHLIIISRGDGRGITALEVSYVMVRGSYEVV